MSFAKHKLAILERYSKSRRALMMAGLLLKVVAIWLVMVIMAIANAAVRENLLIPSMGSGLALPVSGLLLSAIIFLIIFTAAPWFGVREGKTYIAIGMAWFGLTLAFEFLLGYLVAGKAWHEILEVFDVRKGNLFILALLTTLLAPWVSAKVRGLI